MSAFLHEKSLAVGVLWLAGAVVSAQAPATPAAAATPRTIKAVGYQVGKETTVDSKASAQGAGMEGEAKVDSGGVRDEGRGQGQGAAAADAVRHRVPGLRDVGGLTRGSRHQSR